MLFQVVYGIAFVLFLTKTTIEGSEHGVFFQIKENSFFVFSEESLVWSGKADSLLSCSVLSGRETSCRRANFLENQRLCHKVFAAKCKQVQQLGIFTSEMVLYI